MTLAARLIAIQLLARGRARRIPGGFTAARRCASAWSYRGYADGYPRHAPTGTPVLVNGVRTRTVGRVSMDMITVDLTPVPEAGLGAIVTLGAAGRTAACCRSTRWRTPAGTVGYELMCALRAGERWRVPVSAQQGGPVSDPQALSRHGRPAQRRGRRRVRRQAARRWAIADAAPQPVDDPVRHGHHEAARLARAAGRRAAARCCAGRLAAASLSGSAARCSIPWELDPAPGGDQRIPRPGRGRQNVNKVSNAVHLRFDIAARRCPTN